MTVDDVDVYVPHQANKRIIDHAAGKLGIPAEKIVVNVDRYGNTSSGSIPLALADAAADGRLHEGELVLMTGMGAGLTWGSALIEWTPSHMNRQMETERKSRVSKIAFMFPGQGSYEAGMGQDVAEAVPEAMAVYEAGSEASGLDLKQVCFHGPIEDLLDTKLQQPALVTTSLAINAAIRAHGIVPDYVVGHSVGEFAALGAAESLSAADAIRLVRERGIAMAEAAQARPGSMAAILGLADEVVEGLCRKIANVWPANYNCPGQIVISGEDDAVGECCVEAEEAGARRAVRLRVSGAFHSPLVERAAEKLRPAVERIHFADPRTAFMSTVTAKLEDAGRYRELLVEQLTAPVKFTQAAARADRQGRDGVRRGRPRQCAQRFTEEDRQERAHRLRQQHAGVARAGGDACLTFLRVTRRKVSPRHRSISRNRSRDRGRARGRRRHASSSATGRARRKPKRSPLRSAAVRSRRTSRARTTRDGSSRRPATSTSSSTTRASPATACWLGCPTRTGER